MDSEIDPLAGIEGDEAEPSLLLSPPTAQAADVYILGAGFSRALHPRMPLVKELSTAVSGYATSYPTTPLVTSGIDSAVGKLIQRNFEEALSYLAQDKPWLEESENKKDEVRLLELSRNIRVEISRAQKEARGAILNGQLEWIVPLFEHWHLNRTTVITLNYDTLVEEIAEQIGSNIFKKTDPGPVFRRSFIAPPLATLRVCNILPKTLRDDWLDSNKGGFASTYHNQPSFQLLKLHGSVNWVRSTDPNAHSDTISYIPGDRVPTEVGARPPSRVADKTPYIVPPVPNKASLVKHDSLRAMWRDAADAIRSASRIVVMGYSMPSNDTLLIQLIRGNLFNHNPTIELVNPDPKLGERVSEMFSGESSKILHRFSDLDGIRQFVSSGAFALDKPPAN